MTSAPNLGTHLIGMLIDTAQQSAEALRSRISNVRDAPLQTAIDKKCECILFDLDGHTYLGEMRGRNRDLCIDPRTAQAEANRAIAVRVLLDCHATRLDSAPSL